MGLVRGSTLYGTASSGGGCGAGVLFSLELPNGPFIISSNPTAAVGSSLWLTARDLLPDSTTVYQWYFNATNALNRATNLVLQLTNIQFSQAGAGGNGGIDGSPGVAGESDGPVLGAWLVNTLLAANIPTNGVSGAIIDTNYNLWADDALGVIGPLTNSGGPTLTMALLPGSPAIDAADTALAPPIEQRGCPRSSGSADTGAYEFGYPPTLQGTQSPEGGVDISVSGRAGQTQRFYRAVMP